jgi:L-ribulose-5-phosphate 4-epimerase
VYGWSINVTRWSEERALVLSTGLKLVEKGLVVGTAGNVSQRLSQNEPSELMVITPTSRYYDLLTVDDIPVVDFDGNVVDGRLAPSSEVRLHIAIYKARKDVSAIIHTHSTYASAISVSGLEIPAILEVEVAFLGGAIRTAKYAQSGTSEIADNAVEALGNRNAVLLANHGAIGVGATMRQALDACELVEKTAQVYLLALATGRVNSLPPGAMAAIGDAFTQARKKQEK